MAGAHFISPVNRQQLQPSEAPHKLPCALPRPSPAFDTLRCSSTCSGTASKTSSGRLIIHMPCRPWAEMARAWPPPSLELPAPPRTCLSPPWLQHQTQQYALIPAPCHLARMPRCGPRAHAASRQQAEPDTFERKRRRGGKGTRSVREAA